MADFPGRRRANGVRNGHDEETLLIERVVERLNISKQMVQTGKVEIHRSTVNKQVPVDISLTKHSADVDIVPIGRYVETIPQVREEGDITVIPVCEEHIEVVKKIYLKEEVKISRKQTEERFTQEIEVKEHIITVNRNEIK